MFFTLFPVAKILDRPQNLFCVPDVVAHACNPSTLAGRAGQITCGQEFETSLANMVRNLRPRKFIYLPEMDNGRAMIKFPSSKALSNPPVAWPYKKKHFGKPRQADHLRSGVQDHPGQHGETPSLLKTQSQHFGRPRQADRLKSGVRVQPDQHGETPSLIQKKNSPAWWHMPIVPDTLEAEAGEFIEPRRQRLQSSRGQPRWLMPVIPALWEAGVGRLSEVRSSRPDWPT
ncbi:putative uncharacterized protein C8orf44, partial [Plecturocebus cupreus]